MGISGSGVSSYAYIGVSGFGVSAAGVSNPLSSLDLNFAGSSVLDPRITFSRGSQATLFDSTGALVYAPNNMIRNNTMVGVVAGTPGTLPTNWTGNATVDGLSREIVGAGVENGINYVDVRFSGTSGTGGNSTLLTFESQTQVVASNGQTWAASAYVKLVAGSLANVALFALGIRYNNSGGTSLTAQNTTLTPTATFTRYTSAFAATDATTAFVNSSLVANFTDNSAVDLTLRIGMPQLELGSVATAVNATSGTAYYGPRFDYNPSTLAAQGLLIEEQRTNSIRNNTMQGAVAGTPGTVPTNWTNNITAGLTQEIVGTGTENGITYIDWRLSGTATGTSQVAFESTTQITAAASQAWTATSYARLVAGSLTNVSSLQMCIREGTAAGGFVRDETANFTPTSAALRTQRASVAIASTNALTERVMPRIFANTVGAVDFTLRIGLPQLEQGAFATSVIPTTTTALTRNADVASMTGTNFSSWFNASEGTIFSQSVVSRQVAIAGTGIVLLDGGAPEIIRLFYRGTGATAFGVTDNSVTQCDLTPTGVLAANAVAKLAGAYKLDDFATSGNGGAVTTDPTGTLPTVNQLTLGFSSVYLNGWIQRISYYPVRLPNSTLQALTA